MRLARKVTPAKWRSLDKASPDSIPADAISIDLRTRGNTLSFWEADPTDADSEECAILALVGTLERIDKIDVAFIEAGDLANIDTVSTPGTTLFTEFSERHLDLANLDHCKLAVAARTVGEQVYGAKTKALTRKQVKTILQKAADEGRLDIDSMHENLRGELGL